MTNTVKVQKVQKVARVHDADEAAARRARFGTLPERIRREDTVESYPATVLDPARNTYSDDDWLIHNVI